MKRVADGLRGDTAARRRNLEYSCDQNKGKGGDFGTKIAKELGDLFLKQDLNSGERLRIEL